MNAAAAIKKYIDACNSYQDAIDSFEEPNYRQKLKEEEVRLRASFQALMNLAGLNQPTIWHSIGSGFNTGRGVTRDKQEAIRWFQRAADAGHAPAMINLGLCLTYPEPASDIAAAIDWFRKAADLDYAGGMVWLGFAYREGRGVPRDDKMYPPDEPHQIKVAKHCFIDTERHRDVRRQTSYRPR